MVDEGEGEACVSREGTGSSRHFARSSSAKSEAGIRDRDRFATSGQGREDIVVR